MKYTAIFCLCFLLSGARADFLDDLKHYGSQALHSALDSLTTNGVKNLVTGLTSAAGTALITSLLGKRASPDEIQKAVTFLKQEGENIKAVFHHYGADLQEVYNNIENLHFLEHNAPEFLNNIDKIVANHNDVLDKIVDNFRKTMSKIQHSRKRALLDGFATAFQQTVDKLKETFGQVAGGLKTGGTGLLGNLAGHLGTATTNLNTQLSGLKETAAQLLAAGQEHLQNLHNTGAATLDQVHTGLLGAGKQVVDTLLHPAGTDGK